MKVIETRIVQRGNRLTVAAEDSDGNKARIPFDSAFEMVVNHAAAAEALANKMAWHGRMIGGHTRKGMVWVWDDTFSPHFSID